MIPLSDAIRPTTFIDSTKLRDFLGLDRDFVWSDADVPPTHIQPYQHLMTRVDA